MALCEADALGRVSALRQAADSERRGTGWEGGGGGGETAGCEACEGEGSGGPEGRAAEAGGIDEPVAARVMTKEPSGTLAGGGGEARRGAGGDRGRMKLGMVKWEG